jgi:hypothetical protein
MRLLLALFSFLALALAPFATPAAAMTASTPCSAEMDSHHAGHDQMPADHGMKAHADLCCIGLASALPASSATMNEPLVMRPPIVASPVIELSGIQPAATDPPPRA